MCLVSGRSTSLAVGRLSDPINSQGVNKQLTASGGGEGDGRGREGAKEGRREGRKGGRTVFLTRCLSLPHGWARKPHYEKRKELECVEPAAAGAAFNWAKFLAYNVGSIYGISKRPFPGCKSAAGKLRQKR